MNFHHRCSTIFIVKGPEKIAIFYVRVVYFDQIVLLWLFLERSLSSFPFVASLLLEYLLEISFRLFNCVEGASLVHSFLANATPSSNHNVKVTIGVMDQLQPVKYVISMKTIFQVNLLKYSQIRTALVTIQICFVLDFTFEFFV